MDLCRFSISGFGAMDPVTGVSEKVPSTVLATSGGFENPRVGVEEIGALVLATGAALHFLCASVTSFVVVGLKAGGTDVTFVEDPGETGDDIVMVFLVEQDQLFGLGWSKTFDVVRTVRVDQDDLVLVEGGCGTESGQLFVPTRTKWYVGFFVEKQGLLSLNFSSFSNGLLFGVLVHLGFGGDQGKRTAQVIVILDADDGLFVSVEKFRELISGCQMT